MRFPPGKEARGILEELLSEAYMKQGNQVTPGLDYLEVKCSFSQLPRLLVADSSQLSSTPHFHPCPWLEKASLPKVKVPSWAIHSQ